MASKFVRVTHASGPVERLLTPMRVDEARSLLAKNGRFGRGFLEVIIGGVPAELKDNLHLDAGMVVTFLPEIEGKLPAIMLPGFHCDEMSYIKDRGCVITLANSSPDLLWEVYLYLSNLSLWLWPPVSQIHKSAMRAGPGFTCNDLAEGVL
jgi:hypothetical protein